MTEATNSEPQLCGAQQYCTNFWTELQSHLQNGEELNSLIARGRISCGVQFCFLRQMLHNGAFIHFKCSPSDFSLVVSLFWVMLIDLHNQIISKGLVRAADYMQYSWVTFSMSTHLLLLSILRRKAAEEEKETRLSFRNHVADMLEILSKHRVCAS